jgi:hypothetical protein
LTRRDIDRGRDAPRRADIGNRGDRTHPEITHYKVRRELFRTQAVGSLPGLEHYLDPVGGLRLLTPTTDAMTSEWVDPIEQGFACNQSATSLFFVPLFLSAI